LTENSASQVREKDLVQLVGLGHKSFLITVEAGEVFHTHRGIINHDEIIGKRWGSQVLSHNGSPFFILQPTLPDILRNTKRATQIMYPKEIGYLLLFMGILPGAHVIEAGTGSGSLTTALASAVGTEGRVYSYDAKEDNISAARKTIEKLHLLERVDFFHQNIENGFFQNDVDALFLDVANPYDYIQQVRQAIKPGGQFGCIVPTTNQVIKVLVELRRNNFAFIEVCDISVRFYKTEPTRFRPVDRMIAHTGYLIFGRPVEIMQGAMDEKLLKEIGALSALDDERNAVVINED